jgi:hypothetical protein
MEQLLALFFQAWLQGSEIRSIEGIHVIPRIYAEVLQLVVILVDLLNAYVTLNRTVARSVIRRMKLSCCEVSFYVVEAGIKQRRNRPVEMTRFANV